MSEDSGSSRRGPFPALPAVALILIVSAIVLQVPALKSSRPQHDPLPELGKVSARQVRARLWQDPLQAVYAENEKRKEERRKGDLAEIKGELSAINGSFDTSASPGEKQPDWRLNLKIQRGLGDGTPEPGLGDARPEGVNARDAGVPSVRGTINAVETSEEIEVAVAAAIVAVEPAASRATEQARGEEVGDRRLLLLPVLLQGGPYAEAAEMRMRTRYAVLSALGRAGFKPEHGERLRYISLRELLYHPHLCTGEGGTVTPGSYKREFLIPFERWHKSDVVPGGDEYTPVYVVWIDEDALKDRENVVYDLDTEFAWRLSRTLAMFERWLSDDRRLEIIRKATPRVLSQIPEWLPEGASPALRSAFQEEIKDIICERVRLLEFEPAEYRVIGPVSSESLLEIRNPRQPYPPYLPDGTPLPFLEFYCLRATVANRVLDFIEQTRVNVPNSRLESENQVGFRHDDVSKFIKVYRTTATDDQLVKALLTELRLRDASPSFVPTEDVVDFEDPHMAFNLKNHMVFIGEWDTLYGRARRCTLLNEITEPWRREKNKPNTPYICDDSSLPDLDWANVHFVSYMRGLDGRTPDENKPEGFRPRDLKANEVEVAGELPVGPAQLDYLRRLQKQLRKLQRDLAELGMGELKAIGVIGSDVYDKLLILKALRPHFPRVVFFTTDLDAQMVHPSENEHARNLIVASPYGLTLHPDLQRGIPPFRDSYQTATYLSTLYAIGDEKAEEHMGKPINLPAPRIFEIGRSSAHDLTILDNVSDPQDNSDPRATSVHPDPDFHRLSGLVNFHPIWAAITFFLGLFLLWPLILTIMQDESKWYSSQQARPLRNALYHARYYVFMILFAAVVAVYFSRPWEPLGAWSVSLLANFVSEWRNHTLEPLVMFQGISAWPTEFLRMIAFVLSLWFVLKIYLRLEMSAKSLEPKERPSSSEPKRDEAKIDEEVANPLVSDEALQDRNWPQILRMKWKNDQMPVAIMSVWNEYRLFGKLRWRAARACFWALVYFLFGSALFALLGYPAEPLRGTAIVTIDNVAFYTSVVALLVLVFWVLDASRLCDGFVRQISRENVFWRLNQESAKDKTGESRGDRRGNLEKTRLIAALTNAVGQCLWYPFLILFLLIMSRNSVFDDWDWPLALVSLCVFLVAATLLSGWLPRRSARFARRFALQMVNAERGKLKRSSSASGVADPRLAYLDYVIDEINAIRTGGFSSVAESPALGAPLIPVVLYGLTELLATLGR